MAFEIYKCVELQDKTKIRDELFKIVKSIIIVKENIDELIRNYINTTIKESLAEITPDIVIEIIYKISLNYELIVEPCILKYLIL